MKDFNLKPIINHLLILDESASMQSIQREAISSFNDTITSIKRDAVRFGQEHRLTLLTFNGKGIKQHFFNQPAELVALLSEVHYSPDSGTPLMDCLGLGIGLIKSVVNRDKLANRVIVTIVTDGAENGSSKYCMRSIGRLIDLLKRSGWIFNYIGANHDVYKICSQMNIDNYYIFKRSGEDLRSQMLKERMAKQSFYSLLGHMQEVNIQAAA